MAQPQQIAATLTAYMMFIAATHEDNLLYAITNNVEWLEHEVTRHTYIYRQPILYYQHDFNLDTLDDITVIEFMRYVSS
jgi:hypothetical protein